MTGPRTNRIQLAGPRVKLAEALTGMTGPRVKLAEDRTDLAGSRTNPRNPRPNEAHG